jgi:hypothetical protein
MKRSLTVKIVPRIFRIMVAAIRRPTSQRTTSLEVRSYPDQGTCANGGPGGRAVTARE